MNSNYLKRSNALRRRESRRKVGPTTHTSSNYNLSLNVGLKVLKQSGVLDSYSYLLSQLCKYGLPTGDLYEFSALTVLKYEKKIKLEKKRELENRLKQRQQTKPNPRQM